MELPRFFSDEKNDQSPPRQRSAPADLSAEELAEISHMLVEQAGRRRRSSPTDVIRIMVDGVERGRLNPAEQASISFTLEEDAEIIEVKTTDPHGDLLLATHLLTSFGKEAHHASIRLEGGQELSLSITRRPIDANGGTDLRVKFGYKETNLRRAARLWWQRLNLRLSPHQGPRILWGGALAVSVVVICLASYLSYVRLRSRQTTSGPPQTSSVQTTSPNQDHTGVSVQVNDRNNVPDKAAEKPARRTKSDRSIAANVPSSPGANPPAQAGDEDVADVTRSGSVVANLRLRDVKKVYIEIRGDAAFNELHSNLVESLGSSGVVAAATNADDADAALKIVVSQTRPQIEASALLVNARGTVLWQGARRYSGEIPKVVSEIVKDLLVQIRLARAGN